MGSPDRTELLDTLTEGISSLTSSERWRRHLDVQTRFHRYSFGNALLIAAQFPEATRVAGFASWKKLGRSVTRGESAIWILAPVVGRKVRVEEDEEHRPIRGFRTVPVFDVSQTTGDPLPDVCHKLAGGDPSHCLDRLVDRAERVGYAVVFADLPGTVNGDCSFAARRIRIESRNAPDQQVKTLAHELAHALLHEEVDDRSLAELEAESTAYLVCRSLGLDSGTYSFGYVATWAGGGDQAVAGIRASGGRIQHAASVILDASDTEESTAEAA